ncbi:SH3 domain-containing protein [Pedobacter sp. HMF7647]|uniref:SH3 domain-containing protein n=1 Tax=Hufsiella arboris TaxID=2695275 RepID=A0A7K1YF36_9SPHI|nr:C40 family peptidase [Hufsiella arboris]MXV52599.1 SH3 domain-containing protein [Hufsiella arboris]
MDSLFGICNLTAVPLRAEPSDRSEMVSQLLFGDHFQIIEATVKWTKVITGYDDYEGWIDSKQYVLVSKESYEKFEQAQILSGLASENQLNGEFEASVRLVPGSSLLHEKSFTTAELAFHVKGQTVRMGEPDFKTELERYAKFYLNSPYLWGGKTPFGIDCSGFCQVVFKFFGIRLKRDASQQAAQGMVVDFLQNASTGDLAFFDNEEGRIIHVGIMLGNSQIIHASGKVRIDSIDNQGIYNEDTGKHTHKLRIIKRYV